MAEIFLTIFFISVLLFFLGSGVWVALSMMGVLAIGLMSSVLSLASFFSGYLAFYFIKMLIISYKFQERSEGADEILIWIPQTSVAIGSTIFFICVFHQFILNIKKI